jgi:tRNA(Ile)-lysidine synthetase-like protein
MTAGEPGPPALYQPWMRVSPSRSGTEKSAAKLSGVQPSASIRCAYFSMYAGTSFAGGSSEIRISPQQITMSASIPSLSRLRLTRGLAAMFASFGFSGRLYRSTERSPFHRNQTGIGRGAPSGVTVVSHPMIASRRRRVARRPNSVDSSSTTRAYRGHNGFVDVLQRIEALIRRHELIEPGGEVVCLVSGGADSMCLWHALGELGYRVSAVHVNHGLRGSDSEADAAFCRDRLGAEVIAAPPGETEAELRDLRYELTAGRGLRATGHTASDQVETVLYRIAASGSLRGIKPRREDGVVRPLLGVWREETEAYCSENGVETRVDASNPDTLRGLIRYEIVPLLRRLHPAAEENIRRFADERPRLPRGMEETLLELLSSRDGSKSRDLGRGIRAVREYDRVSLDRGPVRWGPWLIEGSEPGLEVRTRRSGDRVKGRRKLQDVFVDAKVPRAERDDWPVVVAEEGVVAVPGIVEDARVRVTRETPARDPRTLT